MISCLAPAVLVGYAMLFGGMTTKYPLESSTPQLEIQSCQRGFGGYINATPTGLYSGGLQYGFQHDMSYMQVSLIPHFGLSHTDHEVNALPSYTQFDIGGGLYVSYRGFTSGVKFSHWSNGNAVMDWGDSAGRQNVGINMVVLQAGYQF